MRKFFHRILCLVGIHQHVLKVDERLTSDWLRWCLAAGFPTKSVTPCTYLECSRCGHTYESRTVGVKMSVKQEGE
jgi:hypothetical protein